MKKIIFVIMFTLFSINITDVKAATHVVTDIEYEARPETIERFEIAESKIESMFKQRMMVLNVAATLANTETDMETDMETDVFSDWIGLLDRDDVQKKLIKGSTTYQRYFDQVYNNVTDSNYVSPSGGEIEFVLTDTKDIHAVYSRIRDGGAVFSFYDEQNVLITSTSVIGTNSMVNKKIIVNAKGVKRISMTTAGPTRIGEIEFDVLERYAAIDNFTVNTKDRSAVLGWEIPKHNKLIDVKINKESIGLVSTKKIENLIPNSVQEVTITAVYSDGVEIDSIFKFITERDIVPPDSIKNLKATQINETTVEITFDKPNATDFSHVNILRDGKLIASNIKANEYIDIGVKSNNKYEYTVVSYDDVRNAGIGVSVDLDLTVKEVLNLRAIAKKYNEVNLLWDNPIRTDFEHVSIHRKEDTGISLMRLFNADDGFDKLFETNGTEFKDFTVSADTKYSYRVTSTIDSDESDGKIVDVKTPKINISGSGVDKTPVDPADPTSPIDSYTIFWEDPVKGKIKVIIGGVDYKIVNAADKSIIIPAKEMKLTALGMPDVLLMPVNENGEDIGIGKDPVMGGVGGSGGFVSIGGELTAVNLLKIGVGLLSVVGLFVLLGLAFRFTPRLVALMKDSFKVRRN